MRQFQKVSAIGLVALLGQTAFAIQGNLQSSSGIVASSVAGATVAQFTNEFDAVIDNPALMEQTPTKPGTHRFALGIEYASYPNSFAIDSGGASNPYVKGKVDTAWIPFAGYFYNINERFKFATGFFAIGGTGYDYSNSVYKTKGTYKAASIPVGFSYKLNEMVAVGAALDIIYTQLTSNNFDTTGAHDKNANAIAIAPSVGATLALPQSLLLGADLTLGTTSTYKNLYVVGPTYKQSYDVKIGTPLEFSIGIGQNKKEYSIGFKYRFVNWANTENYKQLAWKNQSTFSVGGQYMLSDKFIGRAGIYYVTQVFGKMTGVNGDTTSEIQGVQTANVLRDFQNAMMYAAPQWQYALGAGYIFGKSILDFGVLYEPEATIKFKGTTAGIPGFFAPGAYEIRKKNSNLQIFLAWGHQV